LSISFALSEKLWIPVALASCCIP